MANNDRTTDLTIKMTDLASQPIKQVVDQVKQLIEVLQQQAKLSQSGAANANEFAKSLQDVGKAADVLLKQKAALADYGLKETRVDQTAARVDIARGRRDTFEASLPTDGSRTGKQTTELNALEKKLAAAQTAATRAGEAYAAASARLDRMGVDALKVAEANTTLSASLYAVGNAVAAGRAADATAIADRKRAVEYVEMFTGALKEMEAGELHAAEVEKRLAKETMDRMAAEVAFRERVGHAAVQIAQEQAAAEEAAFRKREADQKFRDGEAHNRRQAELEDMFRAADAQKEADAERERSLAALAKFQTAAAEAMRNASEVGKQYQAARMSTGGPAAGSARAATSAAMVDIQKRYGTDDAIDAEAATNKLNESLAKGQVFTSSYKSQMEQVYAIQRKIASDAGLIDAFRAQEAAAEATAHAFMDASKALHVAATATPSAIVNESELTSALRKAEAAHAAAGSAAAREATQLEKLRAQAKAAGIDTTNLAAAQAKLVAASEKLAVANEGVAKKEFGLFGLKPNDLKNLEYQLGDIYTQLSLGQGLFRTFNSQADQIFQLFNIGTGSIMKIVGAAALLAVPLGLTYEALKRIREQTEGLRGLTARSAASVDGDLYNPQALLAIQNRVEKLGMSFKEAGEAVDAFVKVGIAPERIEQFAKLSQDMADIYGTKLVDNAKEVASAFTGTYDAIIKLDRSYNFLSLAQQQAMRDAFDQGDLEKGRLIGFNALTDKQNEAAHLSKSSWQLEVRALTNAWHEFLDAIGKTTALSFLIEQLTEILRLSVLIARRWSGDLSAENLRAGVLRMAQGKPALGRKEEELTDKETEREALKEQISMGKILGTKTPAELDAMRARLAEIEARIGVLRGEAGIEGLQKQIEFLEKRREDMIRRGVTSDKPSLGAATASNAGVPAAFGAMRDQVAAQVGLDPEALARLQRSEGVYKDGQWQNSDTGAIGPMQTIQSTFDAMKAKYKDITGNVHDEYSNLLAGAYYFREKLLAASGDIKRGVHEYHDGSALPGGPSKDAAKQADTVGAGYTGAALQPNNLSEVDAQLAKLRGNLEMFPGAVRETNTELKKTGPIIASDSALLQKANDNFEDEMHRRNALARDRNLTFAQEAEHNKEAVKEFAKQQYADASAKVGGALSEGVKKEIEERIEFERRRRQEALDKRIEAERKRQQEEQQAAINNLNALQARIDGMDKTNAAARRKAVDEQYAKDYAQLEEAGKRGLTSINGESLEAFRTRLDAAKQQLKDQVSVEADIAVVNKLLEERKLVYEAISKDLKAGTISIAQAFERMTKATTGFAPRIREAAATAKADLQRQGGASPSAAVQEGLAKVESLRTADTLQKMDLIKQGMIELDKLDAARQDTVRAQGDLVKDGLATTREGELKIAAAFAETKGKSDTLVASLREQIEAMHATGELVGPAYDLWIAKLDLVAAKSQYVSQETKALIKGIEQSFESRGAAAFEAVASSLAGLANGTKKLKDVFADVGRAFGDFAAGMLMDIAKLLLKTELLALAQAAIKGLGGGAGISNLIGSGAQAAGAAASGASEAAAGASEAVGLLQTVAAVAHSGGLIGGSGMTRGIDPAAFANAVRFHTGGMVGLGADEVPAILQRGEQVISKSGVRQAANSNAAPAAKSVRNVLVVGDAEVAGAMAGAHGEDVVMSHLKRNLPTVRKWL